MPATERSITTADAIEHIRSHALSTDDDGRVGAEVEWVVVDPSDRLARTPVATVASLASSAARTRVTFEPGGQLELSSDPGGLTAVCDALSSDEEVVARRLQSAGLTMIGIGLDPIRADRRVVFGPRYDAMERYFDADGPEGRRMMCGTASIQVNVDAGGPAVRDRRWRRAHTIGPMLVAAFANSPFAAGAPTGWRSTRLANWWAMDRSRTAPPPMSDDAAGTWASYALAANVMMIGDGERFDAPEIRFPFRDWIERGYAGLYPTIADLDYHVTTLFPPVRARGWLEIRYLDAQEAPWWRAAVAVTVALMNDAQAAGVAEQVCAPLAGRWMEAARDGLSSPGFAAAARACFDAVTAALPRLEADDVTAEAVRRFVDTFVARGRCPADALMERPATSPALVAR
ncbi:MAG TPA: glutamate-cysteine ligase family protein [Actinomycetota bacterium]|nr:glutamate-cysteine ligase family protein [Actinomycetota bacterium]